MRHRSVRKMLAERFAALPSKTDWPADMSPRPYQTETFQRITEWLEDPSGPRRAHFVHATGLGKTFVFASLIGAANGSRSLVIVPKKVLVRQTVDDIYELTGEKLGFHATMSPIRSDDGEIIALRGHHGTNIVVTTEASFKSRARRLSWEFKPHLIVWDECHGGYSEDAQFALRRFPEAVTLACSATPDYLGASARKGFLPVTMDNGVVLYGDPKRFAKAHFGDLLDERHVRWGIHNRYLAPLAWGHIEFDFSLDDVRVGNTDAGQDYLSKDLQEKMQRNWPLVCDTIKKLYQSGQYDLATRQTIAVCPNVKAAQKLAETIGALGVPSAWITGETPDEDRRAILKAFEDGEIKFLTSVRVLREGWDAPVAEVALMLIPTRSRLLYVQFMGRILRLYPGKVALVIDAFFRGTKLAPLSAPVLFGDPLTAPIRDGDFIVRPTGGGDSPYLPPGVEPKLVVVKPIEVEWGANTSAWEKHLAELQAYRERFGDCDVPVVFPENPQLATWVLAQRKLRRGGELSEERIAQLNAIEFVWNAHDAAWLEMYKKLVAYWKRFGDSNVQQKWPEDPKLAAWVNKQRFLYKTKKLSEERIAQLNAIEFVWVVGKGTWTRNKKKGS